jgi:8-hydroxy-5-deazaflavin:NADPH oxidoreductase
MGPADYLQERRDGRAAQALCQEAIRGDGHEDRNHRFGRHWRTLTRRFRGAGYEVAVANSRGPQSLEDLAQETGAHPATVEEVARDSDVVVVTIPMKEIKALPRGLFVGGRPDLIVIDTNNYYPRQRDGRIDEIEAGMTESGYVERTLGHPVVKAFNNIMARHLLENGKPAGAPGRIALPISGDDAKTKAAVARLIDAIGFDTVDAGTIAESWRQQPGSPAYIKDYDAEGVRRALGEARMERAPEFRGTGSSPGTFASPA